MAYQAAGHSRNIDELLQLIELRIAEQPDQVILEEFKRRIVQGELTGDELQEVERVTNWLLDMAVENQV